MITDGIPRHNIYAILLVIVFFLLIATQHPGSPFVNIIQSKAAFTTTKLIPYKQIMNETNKHKQSDKTKRWIVVTSINYPTEDVKRLAELDDWTLVVVGDTATPKDWNLTGVHYLSIESQLQLNYSTSRLLPTKSYTRKNIGYLYAIQHGAEWIYDTDDDNKPYGEGLNSFDYDEYVSGMRYTSLHHSNQSSLRDKLFNPYHFYGNRDMWPRGFPLEAIKGHSNNNTMISCARMRSAAVQQGLVHNDPDVDAIYRLLNADQSKGLSTGFNPYAPPIQLDKKVYSPWNSQNTLFHRRAFFTMFLPTTVAFRVTDIWRSYFSQRLLHLIGEHVAFYPVNAVQQRNAHDYLKDFKDERAVYEQSGAIVDFLDNWNCQNITTEDCVVELAEQFAIKGFWEKKDADLVRSWIDDLKALGYGFPKINKASDLSYEEKLESSNTHFRVLNCRKVRLSFTESTFATEPSALIKRAEQKVQNWRDISDWCSIGNYTNLIDGIKDRDRIVKEHFNNTAIHQKLNMVLVIANNWPWRFSIGLLQRMYEPYFATVFFCGTMFTEDTKTKDEFPPPTENVNWIHLMEREVYTGAFIYQCVARVHQLRLRNVTGYIFMSDDTMYHQWQPLVENLPAHPYGFTDGKQWWDGAPFGERLPGNVSMKVVVDNVKGKYKKNEDVQNTWKEYQSRLEYTGVINKNQSAFDYLRRVDGRSISDWYYIPYTEATFYTKLMDLFVEARTFLEIAIGKYLRATPFVTYPSASAILWNADREKWNVSYNKNLLMMHPVKLSGLASVETRKIFCEKIAQVHVDVTLKFENYERATPVAGCPTKFTENEKSVPCNQ